LSYDGFVGEPDDAVAGLCARGEIDAATEAALRAYGAEVYGYLIALHAAEADAEDAFALFAEDVWRGLAGFRWGCSLRTWLYSLARHAAARRARAVERHVAGRAAVGVTTLASKIAAEQRSAGSVLRSERRSRIAELRATLPEEDQTLIILRVDRGLSFSELARVMSEGNELDEAELEREAARLRKRFQLAKERLLGLARAEGLLDE
jgi:RNA polymerase sigma-70 factor (ECF subfamily)